LIIAKAELLLLYSTISTAQVTTLWFTLDLT